MASNVKPGPDANLYRITLPAITTRVRRLEVGNQFLRRASLAPTKGSYARLDRDVLDSAGRIDPTSRMFKKLGSIPPTSNTNGFAYTSDTGSITWYWDGTNGSTQVIIRRVDGTMQVIPGGSLTITGLAANTTYFFFPFWSPYSLCGIGWVIGTVGTPQIALVLADIATPDGSSKYATLQAMQDREPLSTGSMSAATTAAGTGGGGAGGGGDPGGGGACVMLNTDIEALGEEPYWTEHFPQTDWWKLQVGDGRVLNCTPNHRVLTPGGLQEAQELEVGSLVVTDKGEQQLISSEFHRRVCTKVKVKMRRGHLYYANGILSHNVKYSNK